MPVEFREQQMKAGEGKVARAKVPILAWQALKWNYLGNLMRGLSQFVIGICLARLLGPEPFGIVAVAWLILGMGRLFADLGFGAALVQRECLSELHLRFIFTCQMAFALFLTISGILSANAIAAYFHKPEAALVIQALFVLFLIDCPGQTAGALLRRALNFKALQQVTVVSYLAGYLVIGIPAAYLGLGVWSLVAAQLVQSLLNSLLLLKIQSVPLIPYFHCDAPDIVKFGLKVTASNLSSWSISNLDTAFIGRAFGVIDLGLYTRALNLLTTPMNIIATGFQGVLFAACARAQNDTEKLKRIYLETTAAVAIICVPIFVTAAVVPDTLILGIYGDKWQASIPLILPLSLAVLVNALLAIKGPILMAGNRVGVELRNQVYTMLLFVPLLLVAIQYSVVATAWTVFATYVVRWILLASATLRFTGATAGDYLRCFRVPVVFGAVVGLAALAVDHGVSFLPAFFRLLAVAAVATVTVVALTRHFGANFLKGNLHTLVKIENLSGVVRKFLNVQGAD
jgi:O-antigen/teichoic acid export membrane protein